MSSTSRLCVKNLPAYVSDEQLRRHFSAAQGAVTDAKVMRTSDGKSRRFGFVGFRTPDEARAAVTYFNKSFLNTCRLDCELARPVADADAVRPWSRHSRGSSAYGRTHAPQATTEPEHKQRVAVVPEDQDPGLDEFLSVMQPRMKNRVWANDDNQCPTPAAATPVSNADYLRTKVRQQWSDEEEQADDAEQPTAAVDEAETGRLFVRNLAYTTSEEELASLFGHYGEVVQVHLVSDKGTNRSKGYGYVAFMLPESATRAMLELDKSTFQGRLLHVLPAKQQASLVQPKETNRPLNLKQERGLERKKEEAGGNTQAWNALYMRPDTVAENVAKQYGISTRGFLDPEADDVAVRLALGETHVLSETKRLLNQQGVDVKLLEAMGTEERGRVSRSSHVILVKNLPFSTTEADLLAAFGAYGGLGRLVLPPTKTVAIVEFLEPSEARKAFDSLAYRKFKHVPLYLEWAPEDLLVAPKSDGGAGEKRASMDDQLATGDEETTSKSNTIFVKNLNFKTSEASVRKHFEDRMEAGSIRKVTVKTKASKNGASVLSMGFGFVEFDSAATAKHICNQMQGSALDGHSLSLQLSRSGADERSSQVDGAAKQPSSKLIVRNVAFEATRRDLKQLFCPFGQVKKVRLPKKFDGNHRGFAFVEFVTKQEAQNAFEALAGSHLYGRHLVLEWAQGSETLEQLRDKTASQVASTPSKRRKLV